MFKALSTITILLVISMFLTRGNLQSAIAILSVILIVILYTYAWVAT